MSRVLRGALECSCFAMAYAEVGSAAWLAIATVSHFPVSTTQTIVGALIGVGSASQTSIYWGRQKDSVSQVAASWGIAPAIAGGFASVILLTIKVLILWRNDLLKWGLCAITVYMAATAAVLAVFIIDSVPSSSLEKLGTKSVNVALGV